MNKLEHPCAETGAAVSGWREEIARIIDPNLDAPWSPYGRTVALAKADAILALLSPPPPSSHDGLREDAGSAQSQPSADAQERSHGGQYFDGKGD